MIGLKNLRFKNVFLNNSKMMNQGKDNRILKIKRRKFPILKEDN